MARDVKKPILGGDKSSWGPQPKFEMRVEPEEQMARDVKKPILGGDKSSWGPPRDRVMKDIKYKGESSRPMMNITVDKDGNVTLPDPEAIKEMQRF